MERRPDMVESLDSKSYKELQVLNEVDKSSDITQRQISQRIKISLGLTNVLLRNLIKKGYLRSQQASWKRWAYSLTPEGMSLKLQLTLNYIRRFLSHYQNVRDILRGQLEPLELHGESQVAILGVGEFSELIFLNLKELGISDIEVFSKAPYQGQMFLGMPVRDIDSLNIQRFSKVLVGGISLTSLETVIKSIPSEDSKLVTFFDDTYPKGAG